jgi:predicted Zn-dependent protease
MQRPASSATRQLLLAQRLLEFGRVYPAHALADQAVRDEPGYRDAWNTLAATQLALRDAHGAGQSLKISEELDGAFGYTWYLKAQLAEQAGKPDDAKRFREHASALGYHVS